MDKSSNAPPKRSQGRVLRFRLQLLAATLFLPLCSHSAASQQPAGSCSKGESVRITTDKPEPPSEAPTSQPSRDLAKVAPVEILRGARVIYVRSTSLLVGASVVEDKLQRRREFQQLDLLITRDAGDADLILELRHDLFTKYVFSVIDPRTQLVVASGKLSSLGGTVAGKVAEGFLKQLLLARQHRKP